MARRAQSSSVKKVKEEQTEVKNILAEKLEGMTVVADTSALLIRGTDLLRSLPDCKLIVPVVVVKELEGKRTSPTVGFLARDWLRILEALRVEHGEGLSGGVPIPEGYSDSEIILSIEPNHSSQADLPRQLQDGSNDSTILAVAQAFSRELKGNVALISNDVPMRIHSTLEIKVPAYEVSSATIDAAKPFSGRISITVSDDQVNEIFSDRGYSSAELTELIRKELKSSVSHALVDIIHDGAKLETVLFSEEAGISPLPKSGNRAKGISPKTEEQRVAMNYLLRSHEELPIVSVAGSAGTGKTLLTIAAGLEGVKQGLYQRVLVFRSLHEMGAGQEMGFLPGGVDEKMAPWSGAVTDSLEVIARSAKKGGQKPDKTEIDKLKADVEVSPISYLRGRSITDTFMVLDEAQNFSRNELLNILSRAGEGTKVILLADPAQVDNRFLQTGPRAEVWSVIDSLKSSGLYAHVTLMRTERSAVAELASSILAS
jgi:PhoH-like ATPase